ncbi:MAG: hypothetical protein GJ680_07515 [Alteromonadaceae bacterium]|nr:hypothetical protein [Alteromonadaceae bacterium]
MALVFGVVSKDFTRTHAKDGGAMIYHHVKDQLVLSDKKYVMFFDDYTVHLMETNNKAQQILSEHFQRTALNEQEYRAECEALTGQSEPYISHTWMPFQSDLPITLVDALSDALALHEPDNARRIVIESSNDELLLPQCGAVISLA